MKQKRKTPKLLVCRHFFEATENNRYGWLWICHGGGDICMYHDTLPPGFVLYCIYIVLYIFIFYEKKEEKEQRISLEDLIEKVFCPRSKCCQNNSRIFSYMQGKNKKRLINLSKKWKEGKQTSKQGRH